MKNKLLYNAIDWISYHLKTDDEFASALRHIGFSRDEARKILIEYRDISPSNADECLIWGYDN